MTDATQKPEPVAVGQGPVGQTLRDGILHLVIDSPPVNALGLPVRAGLAAGIARAASDPQVRAVVLRAVGRTFSAGADISEFGAAPQAPGLGEVCALIENCPKPVVAALFGSVLGGGFELALAAHYRVALGSARVGLPEVGLGILPGAGGTQRVPRLAGAEAALRLMLTGRPVPAPEAMAMGLIDVVVDDGLEAAAVAAAGAAIGSAPTPTRERTDGLADFGGYQRAIAASRAAQRNGRLPGPSRIIECVEAALLLPFAQGLAFERAAFADLVATPQAAALRHAFFAERLAARTPEADAFPRKLNTVAVVGAEGAALALSLMQAGYAVTLAEPDREALVAGLELIAEMQAQAVSSGRMTSATRDADWARLTPAAAVNVMGPADLVLLVDGARLGEAASVTDPGTVLAVAGRGPGLTGARATDVVGVALDLPGGQLAEVIVGPQTSPETVATATSLARRLGRTVLRAAAPGAIGARVMAAGQTAARHLIAQGCTPAEVAGALVPYGLAMLVSADPEKGSGDATVIARRVLSAMVAEGARLVAAGTALRPSDVDLAVMLGYGFARHEGGPMHWADTRGLLLLRRDLTEWATEAPAIWGLPPLVADLVGSGRKFADLNAVPV